MAKIIQNATWILKNLYLDDSCILAPSKGANQTHLV